MFVAEYNIIMGAIIVKRLNRYYSKTEFVMAPFSYSTSPKSQKIGPKMLVFSQKLK